MFDIADSEAWSSYLLIQNEFYSTTSTVNTDLLIADPFMFGIWEVEEFLFFYSFCLPCFWFSAICYSSVDLCPLRCALQNNRKILSLIDFSSSWSMEKHQVVRQNRIYKTPFLKLSYKAGLYTCIAGIAGAFIYEWEHDLSTYLAE